MQEKNHRKWRAGGWRAPAPPPWHDRNGGEHDDNKTGEAEIGDLRSTMETGKLEQKRLKWRTCGAGGRREAGREICDAREEGTDGGRRRQQRKGTCDRERGIEEGEEEKSGVCQLENNKRRS